MGSTDPHTTHIHMYEKYFTTIPMTYYNISTNLHYTEDPV